MPGNPDDFEEAAFWTRAAQDRLEAIQQRARTVFGNERQRTETLIRRDLRSWAQKNAKDGTLNGKASIAQVQGIVQGRMGELLARIQGTGRWPPEHGGAKPPDTLSGSAAAAVGAVDEWTRKLGIAGEVPSGADYLKSDDAKAVYEDHRRNPVGVEERETRQLTESAARWRASGSSMDEIGASLDSWGINPNIFELSTDAHVLAYARNYLGVIADAEDAQEFVALAGTQVEEGLDPEGRTAGVVYRTFDREGLDGLFKTVNEDRRTFSSWRTLGIGHGTHEVFWPVLRGFEAKAEAFYAEERKAFLAGRSEPATKTAAGIARDLQAFKVKVAADLAAGSDLTPAEQKSILSRLSDLLADLRAGTF